MMLMLSSGPHMHMHTPAATPTYTHYACTLMSSGPHMHMHMPAAGPTHTCYACMLTPATISHVENWTEKSLDRQGVKLLSSVVLDFTSLLKTLLGTWNFCS